VVLSININNSNIDTDNIYFFLGGNDLEMQTIRELLNEYVSGRYCDKNLSWGAKASSYKNEIRQNIEKGNISVLVELILDFEIAERDILVIDHHGPDAGENSPTSLEMVFKLLSLHQSCWTHWHKLVAANDRGYIQELIKIGATQEEIVKIRHADRKAQGITQLEEEAGIQAVTKAYKLANNRLTIVHLPHKRTATVADYLHKDLGGPGFDNLLIICPDEVTFYGEGELVDILNIKYPGGWYGGALPKYGFWCNNIIDSHLPEFLANHI